MNKKWKQRERETQTMNGKFPWKKKPFSDNNFCFFYFVILVELHPCFDFLAIQTFFCYWFVHVFAVAVAVHLILSFLFYFIFISSLISFNSHFYKIYCTSVFRIFSLIFSLFNLISCSFVLLFFFSHRCDNIASTSHSLSLFLIVPSPWSVFIFMCINDINFYVLQMTFVSHRNEMY